MNILFALYGDFSSNSANPLALYARELHSFGHSCAVAVPSGLETVSLHENPAFRPILHSKVLAAPASVFPDGRSADVIHACTPREVIRRFVTAYMVRQPTPLVIYLEDNESWIATRALGFDSTTLVRHTASEISDRLPDALAHPFYYDSFIGLADAVAVIQDKLKIKVPPWVPCETVMIGADLKFFSPRPPDVSLRSKYGVAKNEKVIVYHGGMNEFTRPSIETLCRAVGLITQRGYPCRLLRTGPPALDFLGQLPGETASAISDLGLLPRQELPDLLALADVFVQPGRIDPFEDLRLPGKVPEFLAMERPVVMPDVNIAHLFTDGMDAVLLHTGRAEEIAAKCIELFSNPERASAIGRAGRQLAERHFDVRSQARLLEGVYKTACDHFDPAIALETWGDADENTPVTSLLARKLRLLAKSSAKLESTAADMLTEHARYIEFMQLRVGGLEAGIVEREARITALTLSLAELQRKMGGKPRAVDNNGPQILPPRHSEFYRFGLFRAWPFRKIRNVFGRAIQPNRVQERQAQSSLRKQYGRGLLAKVLPFTAEPYRFAKACYRWLPIPEALRNPLRNWGKRMLSSIQGDNSVFPGWGLAVGELMTEQFRGLQPLRVYVAPRSGPCVNLVTDSVNAGSLFGGVATAIIFCALLAERKKARLRVIAREEKANEENVRHVLECNNIDWKQNIDFVFANIFDDRIEVEAGDEDIFVTTSWWTTRSVVQSVRAENVYYLLQEDERTFYPLGDEYLLCSELLKHSKLKFIVNSKLLYDHFVEDGFGNIGDQALWFEPSFDRRIFFSQPRVEGNKRKFFFYARPNNFRNLFHRGLEVIDRAVSRGIIDLDDWDLYFVGKDIPNVYVGSSCRPHCISNLSWAEYGALVRSIDLALCLMYSPHPSYPPLDLAASGAVVVTNRYGGKTHLSAYSKNILCADLDVDNLVDALAQGVALVANPAQRDNNYRSSGLLRDWRVSFGAVLNSLA